MEHISKKKKNGGPKEDEGKSVLTSSGIDGRKGGSLCIPGGLPPSILSGCRRHVSEYGRTPMDASLAALHASSAMPAAC